MAFLQKTVTGFDNIYNEIITFLKTNADLVSSNVAWTKVGDYSGEYGTGEYLRGVGNGVKNVYVLISKNHQPDHNAHNILMMTFTGYNAAAANTPLNQPGASVQYITVATNDTDPCEIVLAANGKRFTGYLHTLSYWNNFYVGMFLPYSEPTHYTFPVALIGQSKFKNKWLTYSDRSESQWGFLRSDNSYGNGDPSVSHERNWTTALIYKPDGQQLRVVGNYDNSWDQQYGYFDPIMRRGLYGYGDRPCDYRIPSPGGVEHLLPVKIQYTDESEGLNLGQLFGELDGIRSVSGVGQQVGKVITDDAGAQWIVSQSGSNSGTKDFHAIRMI